MNTDQNFFHGGATGDVLYALPVIKQLGGGNLYLRLPEHLYNAIKPLLEAQDYIGEVHWRHLWDHNGETYTGELAAALPVGCISLDGFRHQPNLALTHLVQLHCDGMKNAQVITDKYGTHQWQPSDMQALALDWDWKTEGWLSACTDDEPTPPMAGVSYACVNRTTRYTDDRCNWFAELDYLMPNYDRVYFLGFKDDYDVLCTKYGGRGLIYMETPDLLEATKWIYCAGSFTGNQSALLAIAEALGKPYRMERAPGHTNCNLFVPRETVINGECRD